MKFKTKCDYKVHLKTHNDLREEIKCTMCDFSAFTAKAMQYHKRMEHAASNSIKSKGYKCHYCDKIFTRSFKLSQHYRKMHLHRDELFQRKSNGVNVKLRYHLNDNGFYMLADRQKVSDKESLKTGNCTDAFECEHCQRFFRHHINYKSHIKKCDLAPMVNPPPSNDPEESIEFDFQSVPSTPYLHSTPNHTVPFPDLSFDECGTPIYTIENSSSNRDQIVPENDSDSDDEKTLVIDESEQLKAELITDGKKRYIRLHYPDGTSKLYQIVN